MRSTALLLLSLVLVALSGEVGALCAVSQSVDRSCCCPATLAGGNGSAPCIGERGEAPIPMAADGTFDGTALGWLAPPAKLLPGPADGHYDLRAAFATDPVAGHGPALYLLGCSWLN